jgi:hypothetical protein
MKSKYTAAALALSLSLAATAAFADVSINSDARTFWQDVIQNSQSTKCPSNIKEHIKITLNKAAETYRQVFLEATPNMVSDYSLALARRVYFSLGACSGLSFTDAHKMMVEIHEIR